MRIAGFPAALLSMLDAQSFGVAPKEVSDTIAPIIDLTELYSLSKQALISATYNPPVAFTFNAITAVPVGEVWRVLAVKATSVNGAGASNVLTPAIANSLFTQHLTNSLAIGNNQTRTVAWTGSIWATAGHIIGASADELVGAVAGQMIVSVSAIVQRFRA